MCRIIFARIGMHLPKALIPLISFLVLGTSPSLGASVSPRECQGRLSEIAAGRLSADDTLMLNDCALAGLISSSDIERACERAKSSRS